MHLPVSKLLSFAYSSSMRYEYCIFRAKAVVVLDHHASAESNLAGLPDENKVFNMKMSGARLVSLPATHQANVHTHVIHTTNMRSRKPSLLRG